jgi:hypothetical protein
MRGIVVIVGFVIAMILIVGLMVAESPALFTAQTVGSSPTPNGAAPTSLLLWNSTTNQTVNSGTYSYALTIQGWKVKVEGSGVGIDIYTYDGWWIFEWNINYFKWYDSGVEVSTPMAGVPPTVYQYMTWDTLNAKYTSPTKLTLQNSATKMDVSLAYNTTAYPDWKSAWNGLGIGLTFNQDISDRNTSINAVTFIAELFTFTLPGIDPFLNVLI